MTENITQETPDQLAAKRDKAVFIFMIIVALSGLGLGLSDSVFSNYFRDAYGVYALQRGFIEIPRESPGIFTMFIVAALAFIGDMRLAIIAQLLSIIGIMALGLLSPPFALMLVFLFINSLGMHMFIPLYDSLGMSLAKEGNYGTIMGRFNGLRTAFGMIAGILIFVGFRAGFFSFTTPIVWNFVIAGVLFSIVFVLMIYIHNKGLMPETKSEKSRFVFRKAYGKFYLLALLFGARKQIMYVYGPWVLIELLDFGADYMALLIIAGAGIGIFFLPAVGRWIDKYGTAKIMIIEAVIFLFIYLGYGIISAGLHEGWLMGMAAVVVIAVAINIADRTTIQFGMVRNIYMRSIAQSPEDVTPTLATGMAMDHVLSILSAILCGYLWWELGPQYVFVFAGVLAAANMVVAISIGKEGTVAQA
ncbi:MAG: MFS transporter [Defluviitaleaceae bacterium]|nr:MFS transporter [Defluviitaleaceae bacterium]